VYKCAREEKETDGELGPLRDDEAVFLFSILLIEDQL
jgi:hypothetical protein